MSNSLRRSATVLAASAALSALALTPLAVPAPAAADVTGSTSSGDVVLYPQCQTHDVDYAIQVSQGTYFWNLTIQAESPGGVQSGGVTLTSNTSPTSGTVQPVYFCGSETPGTWTVHGTGLYAFFPGANQDYALPDSTFTVRRAMTHTELRQKRVRHHRVRLIAKVSDERIDGFARTEGAAVDIQRRVDGQWQKVKRSRERTVHGRTTTLVRGTRGVEYRAVTFGHGNYDGSTSAPLAVR